MLVKHIFRDTEYFGPGKENVLADVWNFFSRQSQDSRSDGKDNIQDGKPLPTRIQSI
jgi:hypothetical protein